MDKSKWDSEYRLLANLTEFQREMSVLPLLKWNIGEKQIPG
jgi:hypothetical protein